MPRSLAPQPSIQDDWWEASSLSSATADAFGLRVASYVPTEPYAPDAVVGGGAEVLLPPVDDRLQRLLAARESGRAFSDEPLDLAAVARVLAAVGPAGDGRRTVPEAGGLPVVHAYALLRRVRGELGGRIVRYDHRRHSLQVVGPVPADPELRASFLVEGDLPQVVVALAVDLGALTAKYGLRAGRFALQQVGHATQNLGLRVAHDHLVGHVLGGGLDREVLALLRIDHLAGLRYGGAYAFGR